MPNSPALPPSQQLVAAGKWPSVGERACLPIDGDWTISVEGCVARPRQLTLAELRVMPQVEQVIDIHCVTRWSKPAVPFSGVLLEALLAEAVPDAAARFVSFVAHSERGHSTSLPLADALTLGTLVALAAEHRPLEPAHGGPVRIVVPKRYFYKSLKWLARIELLDADRLGYWEAVAGYHNTGDPWREQRYMAPRLSRAEMRSVLAGRDFSGRDLRSLDARDRELSGLAARRALLRDADFRGAALEAACFDGANLSNAHFEHADLRHASFVGADVEGANFSGADLRGADFSGASLVGASFIGDESDDGTSAACVDRSTRFDAAALDQLMPLQAAFLAGRLAGPADAEP